LKLFKNKSCKACGSIFPQYKSTEVVCSIKCAVDYQKLPKQQEKIAKQAKKREAKEDKEQKDTVTDWSVKLQKKVQEIARFIDYGQNCLAKNKQAKQYHGGHLMSRGSNSNIRYNLHNIFAQSAQSNHFQSEDVLMREGVVREFGSVYLDFIVSLKATPIIKRTNEEYMELYRNACEISNVLKKDKQFLTAEMRIEKRNEINLQLNIYEPIHCVFCKA